MINSIFFFLRNLALSTLHEYCSFGYSLILMTCVITVTSI